MHFSIDRTVHTTAFDKPVVDHWLERKIAQTAAGSTEKDRSNDQPLQRQARYRLSYRLRITQCNINYVRGSLTQSIDRNLTTAALVTGSVSVRALCGRTFGHSYLSSRGGEVGG